MDQLPYVYCDGFSKYLESNVNFMYGRVICRCGSCNLLKLTLTEWERHTGSKSKNWRTSVKVKSSKLALGKWVCTWYFYFFFPSVITWLYQAILLDIVFSSYVSLDFSILLTQIIYLIIGTFQYLSYWKHSSDTNSCLSNLNLNLMYGADRTV